MLYLISGASRSGKTLIARKLLAEKQLPYLSLDWLMMGFNDGIPEYGINHLLWPDDIARRIWSFLEAMINVMLLDGVDYVIEGEAMLPEQIAELMRKNPTKVRAVFVGFSDIDVSKKIGLVKQFSQGEDDWLTQKSDEYIGDHIANMVEYSKKIKDQCQTFGVAYYDTSEDYEGAVSEVLEYLTDR